MSLPNPVDYHIYKGQSVTTPNIYAYITHAGGIAKYAATPHFTASVPVTNGATITGLSRYPLGVDLHVPRVPVHWLNTILRHARQTSSIEQMYHFHWLDGWQVAVPKQNSSPVNIDYQGGHEPSIVLDLHSHHEMEAHFSITDDNDEQGCRFYAVIGHISIRPEICLRVGVFGDWLELDPLLLFEELGPFQKISKSNIFNISQSFRTGGHDA